MEIVAIITGVLASTISGMILFFLQKYAKKHEERDRKRVTNVEKENILILKSINAIGNLTKANSVAIKNGHTNGELSSALVEYDKVEDELFQYLLNQNADKE